MYTPRLPLATLPTPLHPLEKLSETLGVEVWMKRDDLTGFAMGGNKVRKAEYLLTDGSAQGCDVVITAGAVQSNHARVIAAAAARCGMDCHLVLSGTLPDTPIGNILLDRLSGAVIHTVATGDERVPVMETLAVRLRLEGRKPYVIPIGGSNAMGAQGYASGFEELHAQCAERLAILPSNPTVLVFPTSSGGTYAGLLVGKTLTGSPMELIGVRVDIDPGAEETICAAANELATLLQLDARFEPSQVCLNAEFVGEGYGIPSEEGLEALRLLWRTEGVLLDPVYTGKAMAGLIALAKSGSFRDKRVVFLHTGGGPAVFARPEWFG